MRLRQTCFGRGASADLPLRGCRLDASDGPAYPAALMTEPVVVVSGLPRSGTSLMMRMLTAGGLKALTDGERVADDDNPRGYFELECVKQTASDSSWLDEAPGKVVKVISQLLPDLPTNHRYKVVFMRRNLDEVLASQKKMLTHREEENQSSDQDIKELFVDHLGEIETWLRAAAHVDVLFVNYGRVVADPEAQAARIRRFLELPLEALAMISAVEPALYRNRA